LKITTLEQVGSASENEVGGGRGLVAADLDAEQADDAADGLAAEAEVALDVRARLEEARVRAVGDLDADGVVGVLGDTGVRGMGGGGERGDGGQGGDGEEAAHEWLRRGEGAGSAATSSPGAAFLPERSALALVDLVHDVQRGTWTEDAGHTVGNLPLRIDVWPIIKA
jgi:hypothetical protein